MGENPQFFGTFELAHVNKFLEIRYWAYFYEIVKSAKIGILRQAVLSTYLLSRSETLQVYYSCHSLLAEFKSDRKKINF